MSARASSAANVSTAGAVTMMTTGDMAFLSSQQIVVQVHHKLVRGRHTSTDRAEPGSLFAVPQLALETAWARPRAGNLKANATGYKRLGNLRRSPGQMLEGAAVEPVSVTKVVPRLARGFCGLPIGRSKCSR
jgi:hypothetical protein